MADLLQIDIVCPEEQVDVITGILAQLIAFGWAEESLATGDTLFKIHTDNAILLQDLKLALPSTVTVEIKEVPLQDWSLAWREFFTPVEAGKFIVLPPWIPNTSPLIPITIEPKSAFGTGHHHSTALCLKALSDLPALATSSSSDTSGNSSSLRITGNFLDLGTGSGILGIGATKLGWQGQGLDIDPVAIANAEENIVLNNCSNFQVAQGSIERVAGQQFDLILANILAEPLKTLAPDIIAALKPEAYLILAGLLDVQAEGVKAAYPSLKLVHEHKADDWVALVWQKA